MGAIFTLLGLVAVFSWNSQGAAAAADVTPRVCWWKSPRAAVVRDTLYLDGGDLYTANWNGEDWVPNSTPVGVTQDIGYLQTLSFNRSFHVTDNFTDLFQVLRVGGSYIDNPVRVNGFMYANDYELITYG